MTSLSTTVRAFVAIELPGEIKEALTRIGHRLTAEMGSAARAVRWVRPEATHLTLQFLGDMPVGMQQLVKEAIARGCEGSSALDLSLGEIGVFPNLKRPRVLWVGVTGTEESMQGLVGLQAAISRELSSLGFTPDKSFKPHLTLGRMREGTSPEDLRSIAAVVARVKVSEVPRFTVSEVSLMKSDLRPQGSIYTRLANVPLASAEVL